MKQSLAKQVEAFNRKYPCGTVLVYRSSPDAEPRDVTVIHSAFVLENHTAVTMVSGVRGLVACDALQPERAP